MTKACDFQNVNPGQLRFERRGCFKCSAETGGADPFHRDLQ
jgi:hypothetical protein